MLGRQLIEVVRVATGFTIPGGQSTPTKIGSTILPGATVAGNVAMQRGGGFATSVTWRVKVASVTTPGGAAFNLLCVAYNAEADVLNAGALMDGDDSAGAASYSLGNPPVLNDVRNVKQLFGTNVAGTTLDMQFVALFYQTSGSTGSITVDVDAHLWG